MDWNPNRPAQLGPQHEVAGYEHVVIDAPGDLFTFQVDNVGTHDWDTVELYAGNGAYAPALDDRYGGLGRPMILDMLTQGTEQSAAATYTDFNVTAVTGTASMYNENLTKPVLPSRLSGSQDGLFVACANVGAYLECQFDTAAFPLNRQVLAVEVHMDINLTTGVRRIDPAGNPWFTNVPMFTNGYQRAVVRMGEAIVEGGTSEWRIWTSQKIRDFRSAASGGTRKIRVSCQAGPGAWRMDRLFLRVHHLPERRIGVGLGIPDTSLTWVGFNMTGPDGTGVPATVSGADVTLMARRIVDYSVDGVAPFTGLPARYLRGRAPAGDVRRYDMSLATWGVGIPALPVLSADGIPAFRVKDSGTVVNGMPYQLQRGAFVYDGEVAGQEVTVVSTSTVYGQAYVVAGWVPAQGRPLGALRVEVIRVADGVRMFSPVDITADEVAAIPATPGGANTDDQGVSYKVVRFRFPESITLAAVQYRVVISSPDSTLTRPWYVAGLIADDHTTDQTYGGTVDEANGEVFASGTIRDLQDGWSSDLQVRLVDVPPAVTGVGASVGSLTAHHVSVCDPNAGCDGCADDTMPYATVTWSPAPSGVAYEVQRIDDFTPDWERVARVDGATADRWDDPEVRIGVRTRYQVRLVRADGVEGDWSDEVAITVPRGQVALAFSSHAATGMGCVYPEVWEGAEVQRDFEFLEAADVTYSRFYGVDRQVAFRPMERRGVSFGRVLLLDALCTVALPTMTVWDPLRDLAWAPVPYVCVRDGEGNRWYASLTVTLGTNRRADRNGTELWLAEVGVVEVPGPSVHDTRVPQVTAPAALP